MKVFNGRNKEGKLAGGEDDEDLLLELQGSSIEKVVSSGDPEAKETATVKTNSSNRRKKAKGNKKAKKKKCSNHSKDHDDHDNDEEEEGEGGAAGDERDELCCPVCFDVMYDPIRIPCQHVFCRPCVRMLARMRHNCEAKCPMCRHCVKETALRELIVAKPDAKVYSEVAFRYPKQLQRYEKDIETVRKKAPRMVILEFGNRYHRLPSPPRGKKKIHVHGWTAFVRVLRDDIDDDGTELRVTDYIRKAYFDFSRFYKHVTRYSSDRVWGGAKGPLEVTRSGWGYFTFTIKVHFQPWLDMEPIELEHELLFEPGGGRQRFVLKLSEAQTEALNKRSQTEKKAGKNKGSGRMGRQSSSSSSSSSSLSSSSAASSAAQSHSVAGFGRRAPRFQSQWPVRP